MIFVINLILLQATYILQQRTQILSKHTNITIFDTFGRTVPLRDLRISHLYDMKQKGLVIIEIILCNAMAI